MWARLRVETGGCPHTAIRDDISANLDAVEQLEARHAPVEPVEQAGHEHRRDRGHELAVDRCDDGVEAGEQGAGGEQIRQQVDAGRAAAWLGWEIAHRCKA